MTTQPHSFRIPSGVAFVVFLILVVVPGGRAATITRDQLTFYVELPKELDDVSHLEQFKRELVALVKWTDSHDGFVRLFSISDLSGTIGRKHLPEALLPVVGTTVEPAPWKSFEIDVFRVPENANGIDYVTFNAQVPLKPRAIQIRIAGPKADETALRALLARTLVSLDGPSNWLTIEQRAENFTRGVISLAIIGAVVFYLVRKIRRRSQATRAPDRGSAES